jgi:hypothetical protein
VDSTFIAERMKLHDARRQMGWDTETIIIPADRASVRKIFEITNLVRQFKIIESLARLQGAVRGSSAYIL